MPERYFFDIIVEMSEAANLLENLIAAQYQRDVNEARVKPNHIIQ
jgi:hypothetical protein